MRRSAFLLLLLMTAPAFGQVFMPTSKPAPLPPAVAYAPGPPGAVPAPQRAAPMPARPTAPVREASRCAAPLATACLAQQSACQVACPGLWSMNPNALAFTPTDRAGCLSRCMNRYLACRNLHGC